MTICGCFKCREGTGCIRDFAVPSSATPTRKVGNGKPREANPAWERGIKGEDRPDGTFMPYLDGTGSPIGVKKFADNRKGYERQVRELATTNPTTQEG